MPIGLFQHAFVYNRTFGAGPIEDPNSEIYWQLRTVGRGTVEYPRGSHAFYTLSSVHQLHCLVSRFNIILDSTRVDIRQWSLRRTMYSMTRNASLEFVDERHVRHCFDYLRQSLMCAADTTLEPVDPVLGGVTGWGVVRNCRRYNDLKSWAEDRRVSNASGFDD